MWHWQQQLYGRWIQMQGQFSTVVLCWSMGELYRVNFQQLCRSTYVMAPTKRLRLVNSLYRTWQDETLWKPMAYLHIEIAGLHLQAAEYKHKLGPSNCDLNQISHTALQLSVPKRIKKHSIYTLTKISSLAYQEFKISEMLSLIISWTWQQKV